MDTDADFTLKNPFGIFGESGSECKIAFGEMTTHKKEHRSVVLPPFGVFGCHQSKRKLVSRNRAELPPQRTRVRRDRGFVLLALKGEHVQHRQLRLKMLAEWDSLSE